jgi:hypothetical protein
VNCCHLHEVFTAPMFTVVLGGSVDVQLMLTNEPINNVGIHVSGMNVKSLEQQANPTTNTAIIFPGVARDSSHASDLCVVCKRCGVFLLMIRKMRR